MTYGHRVGKILVDSGVWNPISGEDWLEIKSPSGLIIVWYFAGNGAASIATNAHEIDTLMAAVTSSVDISNIHFKFLGTKELLRHAIQVAERKNFHIAGQKVFEDVALHAFFCPLEGKIRFEKHDPAPHPLKGAETALKQKTTKVLIVDDSNTMRKVLRSIFSADAEIEVVGECANPLDVEAALSRLKPDVISLDINMPEMDGVALTRLLAPKYRVPIVMVTAISMEQGDQVMQALAAGAVDYIQKPSLNEIDGLKSEICFRFRQAAAAKVLIKTSVTVTRPKRVLPTGKSLDQDFPIILIGASTGGTEAIREVLSDFPEKIPPVVIVQHIPPVFSGAFAKRLDQLMPFEVREAVDGDELISNRVLIAPGGKHSRLKRRGSKIYVTVEDGELVSGHKPSVDALFLSAAEELGNKAIGVILTGMGKDGAKGLLKLHNGGVKTIGQNEATCVVYGMPNVAKSLGAVAIELPLGQIASQILQLVSSWRAS